MKKWAVLFLVLAMVMCFGGCVSQDDYDALKTENESLKASVEELQAANDSLKADCDAAEAGNALYEKYSDVIDPMEAEDYDGALAAVKGRKPAPEQTTIEITADNWQDYFEVIDVTAIPKNEFGKLDGQLPHTEIVLKEQYSGANANGLRFLMDYDVVYYDTVIDTDTGECTLSEISVRPDVIAHILSGSSERDEVVEFFVDSAEPNCKYGAAYLIAGGTHQGNNSYDPEMPVDGGLYVPMVRNIVVKDVAGAIIITNS